MDVNCKLYPYFMLALAQETLARQVISDQLLPEDVLIDNEACDAIVKRIQAAGYPDAVPEAAFYKCVSALREGYGI